MIDLSLTGGRSSSSPVTSSGGAPPLNSLLSPLCSPPTFHIPTSSLGMLRPEVYLHSINLPLCYKICPNNFWQQQPLVLSALESLASNNSSQSSASLMMEVPMLSSLGVTNSKNGSSGMKKEMAPHSSILAWRNPMDKGAWHLQSTGLQRVRYD